MLAALSLVGGVSIADVLPARADFEAGLAAYDAGDYYAAYLEWLPLAKSGDAEAQAAIADLYYSGLVGDAGSANGDRRNRATAAWWYRQAAGCGHVIAQLNLGDFYARGVGVEQDLVQASVWLGLAARAGNIWAHRRRQELSDGMSVQETMRAANTLAAWRQDPACPN